MKLKRTFFVGFIIVLIGIICYFLSLTNELRIVHVSALVFPLLGVVTMICGLVRGTRNTAIVISVSIFLTLTAIGWICGMIRRGLVFGLLCATVFFAIVMLTNKLYILKKSKTK